MESKHIKEKTSLVFIKFLFLQIRKQLGIKNTTLNKSDLGRIERTVLLPKASDHQLLLLSSHAYAEQWSDLTQSCQQIDGVLNWYRINGVGLWKCAHLHSGLKKKSLQFPLVLFSLFYGAPVSMAKWLLQIMCCTMPSVFANLKKILADHHSTHVINIHITFTTSFYCLILIISCFHEY